MNVALLKKELTLQDLNASVFNLNKPSLEKSKVLCINDCRSWCTMRDLWQVINSYCDSIIYTSGMDGTSIPAENLSDYDVIVLCADNSRDALNILGRNVLYDKLMQYEGVIIGVSGFADILSRNEHDGLTLIPCTIRFVENGAHTDDVSCFNVEDTSWYVGADQVVTYNGEMLQISTLCTL